ncbi:amidase [Cyanobacteria bacterium FACHB-472]|nr:amidase [Cyanobacteria bacterium FACHB-472]
MQFKTKRAVTYLAVQTALVGILPTVAQAFSFTLQEATIPEINQAFDSGRLTSEQLVQLYLNRIEAYDVNGPKLNSIITINPDALKTAAALDLERQTTGARSPLHGIPVLLKDNIDTFDLPTTAGSVALKGSIPPNDAFITQQLRDAGAIILGKASLTEYANFLTNGMPAGYSSLNGYTFNPYNPVPLPGGDGRAILSPGGSSAGSAAAVAANLVTVAIGTETSGSILSPGNQNSVVGIKPTVGLVSRDGIIPIAASQDTAGPFGRTVTDAAILLGALTGVDSNDPATLTSAGKFYSDYTPFLKADALKGARIGVPKDFYWDSLSDEEKTIAEEAIAIMESMGAEIIDANISTARELSTFSSSVLTYEFKRDLNAYLASLGADAPVKTLADVIAFNEANAEIALKYGQTRALASEAIDLSPASDDTIKYLSDRVTDLRLAKEQGLDLLIDTYDLDAVLFTGTRGASIGAKAGYPTIIVPAGYQANLAPFGISFLGKAYTEPTLLGLAYAYEQASLVRRPPTSTPPLAGETIPEPGTVAALGLFALTGIGLRLQRRKAMSSS